MKKNISMDFRQYYQLESYLLDIVQPLFRTQGYLSSFDFFCIVIWKANRAKSKIAKKLLDKGYGNLDKAVEVLTTNLNKQLNPKDRLRYLIKDWGINLPMASAILTILYPKVFTIYDMRVCNALGKFHKLINRTNFENLWKDYQAFKCAVANSTSECPTLRDKDRFLWGKSFHDQLKKDIENKFIRE